MGTYKKSSETKAHILEVAFSLFLERGYYAATLIDIAKAAGISTGTLYRHFPTKGEMLFEIRRVSHAHLREVLASMDRSLPLLEKLSILTRENSAATSSRLFWGQSNRFDETRRQLVLALRHEIYASLDSLRQEDAFRRELCEMYASLLADEQREGRLNPSVDMRLVGEAFAGYYLSKIDESILDPSTNAAQATIDMMSAVIPLITY
ncbi:MAG: TetR/AcrR family transcriptional regulator [Eggerthellaceae bacterium]|nr:TetR/AcrR family transcriptional regulator [Eggerthellaceae bacterium]